jgi:thymidylate synthase ThyX
MTIVAEKITDSIGSHSPRCLTIRTTSPKFIHQETLRHRMIYIEDALRGDPDFSFSVSSARAIPFKKLLEEVRSDELRAAPVKWGAEQKGMSPGDEISDDFLAEGPFGQSRRGQVKRLWRDAALAAADYAERMSDFGVHKSIVNRIIEPYIHVHCLMTGVESGWMNFFGLRLDKAADPTLQALAEECWKVWNESVPQKLEPGEWHLPFIDENDHRATMQEFVINRMEQNNRPNEPTLVQAAERGLRDALEIKKRVSAARCARLSYQSFETGKRSTIEEDLNLFNRLVGGPVLHASPCEHQCTPDSFDGHHLWYRGGDGTILNNGVSDSMICVHADKRGNHAWRLEKAWTHPELHGNLKGWIQFRKLLPGEGCAPLPDGYRKS